MEKCLRDVNIDAENVYDVLVVGSTRISKTCQLVRDFFHGKQLDISINLDEAVAFRCSYSSCTTGWSSKNRYRTAVLKIEIRYCVWFPVYFSSSINPIKLLFLTVSYVVPKGENVTYRRPPLSRSYFEAGQNTGESPWFFLKIFFFIFFNKIN